MPGSLTLLIPLQIQKQEPSLYSQQKLEASNISELGGTETLAGAQDCEHACVHVHVI